MKPLRLRGGHAPVAHPPQPDTEQPDTEMPFVARFTDPYLPFRFVAEVRRLYDVSRWTVVDVTETDDGVVVELGAPSWLVDPVADLATRFGGTVVLNAAEAEALRALARDLRSRRGSRRLTRQEAGWRQAPSRQAPPVSARPPLPDRSSTSRP